MAKKRRTTPTAWIGKVGVGGEHPVRVQSMTNTDTADVEGTARQVLELAEAGSELVRFTVNVDSAAKATPLIRDRVRAKGCDVPLIGDFHYNGHLLLKKFPACAEALDKYRINPGNVGFGENRDKNFQQMIEVAVEHQKPVRIGVNWGSLDQSLFTRLMDENSKKKDPQSSEEVMIEAMVQSALQSAAVAEKGGLKHDQIILSVKMSHVPDVVAAYRKLAFLCDYPLHVGLTEAGMGMKGAVASSAALSLLLEEGIGDTIRVSLTPEPNGSRIQEVLVCQYILQSLGLRQFLPSVTACPGCGRTTNTMFQEMASDMEKFFRERIPEWKRRGYSGFEGLKIAVMGCVVNGPGESRQAHIGISLPGNGENPKAPLFIDGERVRNLDGPGMMKEFKDVVENYVQTHFAQKN